MGFETVVLNVVAEVLDNPSKAGFSNGTLFVWCDHHDIERIVRALTDVIHPRMQTTYNDRTGEYSIDFIA